MQNIKSKSLFILTKVVHQPLHNHKFFEVHHIQQDRLTRSSDKQIVRTVQQMNKSATMLRVYLITKVFPTLHHSRESGVIVCGTLDCIFQVEEWWRFPTNGFWNQISVSGRGTYQQDNVQETLDWRSKF